MQKKEYSYVAVLDFSEKHIALTFPDFEEALSQADTVEQAVKRAKEVLQLTIESRLDDNEQIPKPTSLDAVRIGEKERTLLVTVELKDKIKYVKKNLTIPEELNIKAEIVGINFSQLLQQALREKLVELETK